MWFLNVCWSLHGLNHWDFPRNLKCSIYKYIFKLHAMEILRCLKYLQSIGKATSSDNVYLTYKIYYTFWKKKRILLFKILLKTLQCNIDMYLFSWLCYNLMELSHRVRSGLLCSTGSNNIKKWKEKDSTHLTFSQSATLINRDIN